MLFNRPYLIRFQLKQIHYKMFTTVTTSYILTSRFKNIDESNLVKKSLLGTFILQQCYSTAKTVVKPSGDTALKSVPIKDLFNKYQRKIDDFKKDQPEVNKVLNYIMESDIKVMKAQADTIEVKVVNSKDKVQVCTSEQTLLKNSGIKLGKFSKVVWGKDSEESRILKAFLDLKNEAEIVNEIQLLQDFENFSYEEQWTRSLLGCYLSKYLDTPRLPLKVFEQLTRSILYKSGRFSKSDNDLILQHIELNDGNFDLDYLKLKLMRPRYVIYTRIQEQILKPNLKSDNFTIDEDIMIVKHVFNNKIPTGIDEIKRLCTQRKTWKSLVPEIQRKQDTIQRRWSRVIYPRILAHLHGTVYLDWKREFFQYIIDNKLVGVTDIDKKIVEERWPSVPYPKLTQNATKVFYHGKRGVPLHQFISENIHSLKPYNPSKETLDFIDAFRKLCNEN